MASHWTNKGKWDLATGGVTSRSFRILLVNTPPATAAAAADLNFVADVTANELSGTGYARKTLANVTITEDDTNDLAKFDADDPTVYSAASMGTIAGAWIYRQITGGTDAPATDILWCFLDMNDLVTNGGDVTLSFNASGISTVA